MSWFGNSPGHSEAARKRDPRVELAERLAKDKQEELETGIHSSWRRGQAYWDDVGANYELTKDEEANKLDDLVERMKKKGVDVF